MIGVETERLFRRGLDLLLAKDVDGFVDLFTPDCTVEFPFATAGAPRELHGREALREYLADYPQQVDIAEFPSVVVHRSTDPGLVIVEFTARGRTVRTGAPYEMRYVVVVTANEHGIVGYRDYWSPVMAAAAFGTLPEFLAAVGA